MFGRSHLWLWIFVVLFVALSFPIVVHAQATTLNALKEDMLFLRDQDEVEAILFFNVFGNNLRFRKHMLSRAQLTNICGDVAGCEGFGANFATHFQAGAEDDDPIADWESAEEVGMDWGLQIAQQANPSAVSDTINKRSPPFKVIVRFGTGAGGDGFGRPETISNFLATVSNQVGGKPFYAIAGPNEPDLEPWAVESYDEAVGVFPSEGTPQAKQDWYTKTGTKLATYMRSICEDKASGKIPANVLLLTPAFNATSESFVPLVEEVKKNGGFALESDCFQGMAINLYPNGNSVQYFWEEYGIADIVGLPIYITETGPFGTELYDKNNNDENSGFRDVPEATQRITPGQDNYHYISPLLGLYPKAERNVEVIRDSLANQGYQAYCATPTYTIEQKFSGDIDAFIANVRAGRQSPREVEVPSSEIIDYNKADTPIFRDTERKAMLKSDMEEFFGYRELDKDTYGQTELQSAPINSLLTENQKCMKSADALVAQRTMCNKLGVMPEQNCALYYTVVPGTTYDILKLFKEYEAIKDGKTDEEACHAIVAQEDGVSDEFRTAMLNASLHIEEAYRIAFLVGVVRQEPIDPGKLFNFFSLSSAIPPSDEVVVLSFRIPDIGTNKGTTWIPEPVTNTEGKALYDRVARNDQGTRIEETESGHTYWDDVMTLTRNVLIPRKAAEKMDLDGSEKRKELRAAAAGASGQSSGSLIYCLMGAQAPYGIGSKTCNDEAVKAVVDIINGTWAYDKEQISCDPAKLTSENVSEIGDKAALATAGDNYKFQIKYGEFILSQIWDTNGTIQPFDTLFQVNGSTWQPQPCAVLGQGEGATGDCTTLNFYLVYPMGYDLNTLEYVLSRTFLTEDQYEAASKNPDIKERFPIFKDVRELTTNPNEEEFTDFLDCGYDDDMNYVCPTKEFTADLASSQGPALFLGARLGHWIHEIQKSFNRLESLAHKYLRTCKNTEEFLLDQCGGPPKDEIFDDKAYCETKPDKSAIIRGVDNTQLNRFKFSKNTGKFLEQEPIETPIADEDNTFFPKSGELGCTMEMSVRAIDGLTLILSGGLNIVPNNPGNILGCTGRVSAARKLRILRLPPEYNAATKATNPNWKPGNDDPGWATAEVLRTNGSSASEIQYEISLTKGYYRVEIVITNGICQSDHTWVMKDGDELPGETYVYDFTDPASCQAGACFDANLQPNMEGGGPVYKLDEEGNTVVDYVIDEANDAHENSFGCSLNFKYSALKYNNTCGGGRAGNCELVGEYPGTSGNCGFWDGLIDDIKNGTTIGGKKGSDAYRAVYGRYPDASGVMTCVDQDSGNPIFGNTIVIRDCDVYTSSLDSLRIFGKIIGFPIKWFMTQETVEFEVPSREVWDAVTAASTKHGCDPWLVLALASSEAEEPGYFNDTRPNNAQTIGMFEFLPDIWDDWTRDNNPQDAQCTWRQPASFNEANKQGLNFSERTNIAAAVDTACRIVLYTGMQKYPTDKEAFRNAFTTQKITQENNFSFGWNNNPLQAEYVYDFWELARKAAEEPPKPQPAAYPYNICTNGEQPSAPPPKPTTPVPATPGANNTGAPPTAIELGPTLEEPGTWKTEDFVKFMNYNQRTVTPHVGTVTYQGLGVIDDVLTNRQTNWGHIGRDVIYTCTLDYTKGTTPEEILKGLKLQAESNGTSKAIGCAASVRIGDLPFSPDGPDQGPNAFRTFWVKPKNGDFVNTCIGPILVMDVAAPEHLRLQYWNNGADYIGDIGQPLFKFIHSGYGAWNGPQDVVLADTEEQCLNTQFGQ